MTPITTKESLGTKKCSKCGKEKDKSLFSKLSISEDGLQYRCKQCHAEYHTENKKQKDIEKSGINDGLYKEGDLVYVSDRGVNDALHHRMKHIFLNKSKDGRFICVLTIDNDAYKKLLPYKTIKWKYIAQIPQEDKEIVSEESSSSEFPNTSEPTTPQPLKKALIDENTKVSWKIYGVVYKRGERVEFSNPGEERRIRNLQNVIFNNRTGNIYISHDGESFRQIMKPQPKETITISVTQDQKEFIENFLAGKN